MKLIWRLVCESWPSLLLASVLGGISGVANVGLLAIVHRATRQIGEAPAELIWAFAGVCAVGVVARVASQLSLVRMSQASISALRLNLCRRILEAPLRQLEEIGTPRMLTVLTNDVTIVSTAFNALPNVFVNAIILLCGIAYLGWMSPTILGVTVLFGLLGFASYWATSRFAKRYLTAAREAQDGLLESVRNLIRGVKELKMHRARRIDYVDRLLTPTDGEVRENQIKGAVIQDAAIVWGRSLFLVAVGLLLFAWPRWVDVSATTLSGFTLAIFFLMSPIERIVAWFPLMARAGISVWKIQKIGLELDGAGPESLEFQAVPAWESIALEGVTHEYRREGQEGGFLLGPIDWRLRPGEIVFVIGGNGSGKTTLIKLLTGLYIPAGGRVVLNGQAVVDQTREGYRQLFSAVFDDAMVFQGLWGLGDVGRDERARRYLADLRLEHVVQVQDGKFSTTELSRGQRKRLALLTAYLEDRAIYIFDEWAADQDPVFKQVFYEHLLPELKRRGRTVVAITHDDRYFGVADRVVKMEDGRLSEVTEQWKRGASAL